MLYKSIITGEDISSSTEFSQMLTMRILHKSNTHRFRLGSVLFMKSNNFLMFFLQVWNIEKNYENKVQYLFFVL